MQARKDEQYLIPIVQLAFPVNTYTITLVAVGFDLVMGTQIHFGRSFYNDGPSPCSPYTYLYLVRY